MNQRIKVISLVTVDKLYNFSVLSLFYFLFCPVKCGNDCSYFRVSGRIEEIYVKYLAEFPT